MGSNNLMTTRKIKTMYELPAVKEKHIGKLVTKLFFTII